MPVLVTAAAALVFPMLMAFAAFSDLFTMRISNRLVLAVVLGFAVMALLTGMPLETVGIHLACAAAALVLGFAFFAFGWIGGGDAKLIVAIVMWFGLGLLLQYVVYASLLGGALTLLLLALRRWPLPAGLRRVEWVDRLHNQKTGVPYGIALAAAALLLYPQTFIFQRLIG